MNTQLGTTICRVAIFAAMSVIVVGWWQVEATIDLHGIPVGFFAALFVVPAFLIWFFSREIWRERITWSSFKVPIVFVLILALPTAFDKAADSIRRSGDTRFAIANDLKHLSLAMLNYQEKQGSFPPAIVRSPEGKPLYSWRVLLLPYLEENQLFKEFHLDEPWDSPNNKNLIDRMPRVYAGPKEITTGHGLTYYQAFVGKGAAFEADRSLKSPDDFPDGVESTILIAEARNPVVWTQPVDMSFDAKGALPELGAPRGKSIPRLCTAAMVNGRVLFWEIDKLPGLLRPWITRDGKDVAAEPH